MSCFLLRAIAWQPAAAAYVWLERCHAGLQGMSDDSPTVDHFRQRFVEPMGEESDHVHIVAMVSALQVTPC